CGRPRRAPVRAGLLGHGDGPGRHGRGDRLGSDRGAPGLRHAQPLLRRGRARRRPVPARPPAGGAAAPAVRDGGRPFLDDAEGEHGVGDLDEPGDVGSGQVVAGLAVVVGRGEAAVVDAAHDLGEPLLGVLEGPRVPRGVLLHLQRAGGDAAGVGGLAGGEDRARFGEDFDGFRGAGHVGALGDDGAAASDQLGGVVAVELVLGGARQRDVARHLPDGAALDVVRAVAPLGVGGDALAAGQFDVLEQLEGAALLVDDVAARVGAGDDGAAELVDLLDGVDRHVPRSRDHDALAVEGLPPGLEDLVGEEHRAVAGGLGADLRAAPAEAFAGQDAGLVAVGDPLVLAEQVADLAPADAGVTGRDVGVLADVPVQLGHERLAEPHDLALGTALGVEVGAAFAAADGQPGERVLEYLLEPEEFHDPQV